MLVLSRKKGERIRIGPAIEVVVLAVHGSQVRLGFAGPPDVRILREEIYRRMEAESPKGTGLAACAAAAAPATAPLLCAQATADR